MSARWDRKTRNSNPDLGRPSHRLAVDAWLGYAALLWGRFGEPEHSDLQRSRTVPRMSFSTDRPQGMTLALAGHNALRGSGPGQKHAFKRCAGTSGLS